MPSNQKKVRDIERAIKKFGSTPELLRKLEEAKHGKEEVLLNEKKRKNATKYHMVKFLERKKMTRMIRSTESKLKKAEEGSREKLAKLRERQLEDLAYVMYYPIEHKYIALFPSKEYANKEDNSDEEQHDAEKSKQLSKKARQVALERWAAEKQNVADGVEGAVDKVAYAMEVEYKGGAAAAEGRPVKPAKTTPAQPKSAQTQSNTHGKTISDGSSSSGNKKTNKNLASDDDSESSSDSDSDSESKEQTSNKAVTVKNGKKKLSDSSDSSESSDSSSSSRSSSESESDAKAGKKTVLKVPAAKKVTVPEVVTKNVVVEKEESEDEGDDFFMEEAPDSEILAQASKNTKPKVYNDGNDFRYKGERQSVHEIRFAATKRKYERHKRVFNNQNKRNSAQERKKSRN